MKYKGPQEQLILIEIGTWPFVTVNARPVLVEMALRHLIKNTMLKKIRKEKEKSYILWAIVQLHSD